MVSFLEVFLFLKATYFSLSVFFGWNFPLPRIKGSLLSKDFLIFIPSKRTPIVPLLFCPFCPRPDVWDPFPLPIPLPTLFLDFCTTFGNLVMLFSFDIGYFRNCFQCFKCCVDIGDFILRTQNSSYSVADSCCLKNNPHGTSRNNT